MDFGAVISRAIKVTWEHKILWPLGFLVALGSGSVGGGGTGPQFSANQNDFNAPWLEDLVRDPTIILAALSALLCVFAIIGVILWVVGIIARGGLIAGVQQIETEGKTTFGSAWGVGANRFWRVLGLNLLIGIPIVILVIAIILLFGGTIAAMFIGADSAGRGNDSAMGGAIFGTIALACCLVCVFIIIGIIASALQTFGERAIVVEDMGVFASISRGWGVFRANLGNIILLALVMMVVSFIFGLVGGAVAAVVLLPTLLPVITEGMNSGSISSGPAIVAVIGVLIAMVLGAIINTLYITFNSTTWTLAYRQFITPRALVAQPPATVQ